MIHQVTSYLYKIHHMIGNQVCLLENFPSDEILMREIYEKVHQNLLLHNEHIPL